MIKREEILLARHNPNGSIYWRMWGNNCDPFKINSIYSGNSKIAVGNLGNTAEMIIRERK
jgi:hypothetical protein